MRRTRYRQGRAEIKTRRSRRKDVGRPGWVGDARHVPVFSLRAQAGTRPGHRKFATTDLRHLLPFYSQSCGKGRRNLSTRACHLFSHVSKGRGKRRQVHVLRIFRITASDITEWSYRPKTIPLPSGRSASNVRQGCSMILLVLRTTIRKESAQCLPRLASSVPRTNHVKKCQAVRAQHP